MTTAQLDYTESELLASHDYAAPLVAGGVRCHGGFDADGTYVSPRTRYRRPAITAWEEKRAEDFGTPRLDIPLESWPESLKMDSSNADVCSGDVPCLEGIEARSSFSTCKKRG